LRSTLAGGAVRASSPQGRFSPGAALIDGEQLVRADAWGKYLFVDWTGGHCLHVHLGLIGKFRDSGADHPPERDSIRLRLRNDVACWDLTGPTRCELVTPDERAEVVAKLGADPLRRNPDVARARERFARSTQPVGALLLDQTVIAGLGNIYRAEILFLCGIHPQRPANRIDDAEFTRIWAESVRLLRLGVRTGRIITTDPKEIGRPRSRMGPDDTLYVYHREHCRRCGAPLQSVVLAGRPIELCPDCQT
jgi:endonuclease-8